MAAKEYPFDITIKDGFGGKKLFIVTDKITNEIVIITCQKNILKDIEKDFYSKKTVDS